MYLIHVIQIKDNCVLNYMRIICAHELRKILVENNGSYPGRNQKTWRVASLYFIWLMLSQHPSSPSASGSKRIKQLEHHTEWSFEHNSEWTGKEQRRGKEKDKDKISYMLIRCFLPSSPLFLSSPPRFALKGSIIIMFNLFYFLYPKMREVMDAEKA